MLDKEEKAEFKKNHQHLNGSALKVAIRRQVNLTIHSDDLVGRALAPSHIMDDAELKEKYAAKPDQLNTNLKNAISGAEEWLKERETIQW